jgi:hypothetical protein
MFRSKPLPAPIEAHYPGTKEMYLAWTLNAMQKSEGRLCDSCLEHTRLSKLRNEFMTLL